MLLVWVGSIGSKTNFISETLFPTCWKEKPKKKFCFFKTLLLTHKTYSHVNQLRAPEGTSKVTGTSHLLS